MPADQNPRQPARLVRQHPVALGVQGRPLGVRESVARQPPHQHRRQEHVGGNPSSRRRVEGSRRDRRDAGWQGGGRERA